MINARELLVNTLLSILPLIPVAYELIQDSEMTFPCITYVQTTNRDYIVATGCGTSEIGFTIKVWANTIDEVEEYSQKVDNKLRTIGYKRLSAGEIVVNNIIEKILIYQSTGLETYKKG